MSSVVQALNKTYTAHDKRDQFKVAHCIVITDWQFTTAIVIGPADG